MKIKPATVNDLRDIMSLNKDYYKGHWFSEHTSFDYDVFYENIKTWIVDPTANVIVAKKDEEIVAWSVAFIMPLDWSKDIRCSIGYNYIKPEYRSKGVLEQFVSNHEQWGIGKKCVDMNLGDSAQYKGKFNLLTQDLGFNRTGHDCYKVLKKEIVHE